MKRISIAATLVAVAILASGCAVAPYDPYYDATVWVAPPPSRSEYPGYPPGPDYLWLNGYWNWGGGRYVWVPGRWESPRPGYYWTPHRWERDGDHWRQDGGRWEHGTRQSPAQRPVPRSEPTPWPGRNSASKYEHDTRRAAEPSQAYRRQEHVNAPREERNAHAASERNMNSRDDRGNKQRSERKDDHRANHRPPNDEH